jgi:cell division protein FtsW (lipid II flippase)
MAVLALLIHRPAAWGELAQLAALVIVILLGGLINGALGIAARTPKEYYGARIAAVGIAVWLFTVFSFAVGRIAWFTR